MDGHLADDEVVDARHLAVDGAPRNNSHTPVLRDLQDNVVVQDIQ